MSKKLKFGYLVPTRDAVMNAPDGRADVMRMIDLAAKAEAQGFDSVWIGDSLLSRPRFEALTTLAAIAMRTTRVEMGTAVYLNALRHPLSLAHTAGNVDLISGGRFIFGIGTGPGTSSVRDEYIASAVDFKKRGAIQEESIKIMKGLWKGKPFTFHGNHFQIDNALLYPLPARDGGPPILLAGASEKPLRRIANCADGWMPISHTVQEFSENWKHLQDYAVEAGRDPNKLMRILYVTLNINPDSARAEHENEAFLQSYYGDAHKVISATQAICPGNAEKCADFMRGFAQAGVDHFIVRFSATDQEAQMQRLLSDVIPKLTKN